MAVGICIPPQTVDKIKKAFTDGTLNPQRLIDMSSDERHKLFAGLSDDATAKTVNSLLESKLLLKNQQRGLLTWAKKITGLAPEVRRDLISRIEKMDQVLNPADKEAFLKDLAATKLGFGVSQDEAKTISTLSKGIQDSRVKMKEDFTFNSEQERLAYGRSVVALQNYVDDLKLGAKKITMQDFKKNPLGTSVKVVSKGGGLFKSIVASLDDSVIGRQGLKVALTHPTVWAKNSIQSFKDMAHSFGGREVIDEVRAEVLSRKNSLNGLYRREKLDLGNVEEAYPTSAPEKIPGFGRFFKASEAAFTAFQYRTRADLLDGFAKLADKTGGDVKGMGIIANGLTGRGRLGGLERSSSAINNLFFSPRLVMSNINALTGHLLDYKDLSPLARKEAAKNTMKIVAGIAGIMTLANAVKPGSVEFDPKSSDFGKIRIGDTRFDVSGGMASLVTLARRVQSGESKSSSTGAVSKLNSGYGSQSGTDVFFNFVENKLSPTGNLVKDLMNRKDFSGKPITAGGEAGNLLTPLTIVNYKELKSNPRSANTLLAMVADALGISTNTYSASKSGSSPLDTSTGAEINQFKSRVSADQFKAASKAYSDRYNNWLDSMKTNSEYQKLSADDQKKTISNEKAKIQKDIFKQYSFKYRAPKAQSSQLKKFLK